MFTQCSNSSDEAEHEYDATKAGEVDGRGQGEALVHEHVRQYVEARNVTEHVDDRRRTRQSNDAEGQNSCTGHLESWNQPGYLMMCHQMQWYFSSENHLSSSYYSVQKQIISIQF